MGLKQMLGGGSREEGIICFDSRAKQGASCNKTSNHPLQEQLGVAQETGAGKKYPARPLQKPLNVKKPIPFKNVGVA